MWSLLSPCWGRSSPLPAASSRWETGYLGAIHCEEGPGILRNAEEARAALRPVRVAQTLAGTSLLALEPFAPVLAAEGVGTAAQLQGIPERGSWLPQDSVSVCFCFCLGAIPSQAEEPKLQTASRMLSCPGCLLAPRAHTYAWHILGHTPQLRAAQEPLPSPRGPLSEEERFLVKHQSS